MPNIQPIFYMQASLHMYINVHSCVHWGEAYFVLLKIGTKGSKEWKKLDCFALLSDFFYTLRFFRYLYHILISQKQDQAKSGMVKFSVSLTSHRIIVL